MNEQLGIQNSYFIPHGFDPEVHRMIDFSKLNKNPFKNDVSFIGTWSLKKEKCTSLNRFGFVWSCDLFVWSKIDNILNNDNSVF